MSYRLPKGAVFTAAGSLMCGGIVLGLQDNRGQWVTEAAAIPPGAFRTTVQAPADGEYRIVIANNLPDAHTANDVNVTEVGLASYHPALRVGAAATSKINAAAPMAAPERQIEITSLDDGAWEIVVSPARLEGKGLKIKGVPTVPAAYAVVSTLYRLPKGAVVAAAGTVMQGGIVLGLQDSRGQWVTEAAIPPGAFRTTVQAPADGEYRIVIANNLPDAHTANDVNVTEVGLVSYNPAALRVGAPRRTEGPIHP